MELIQSTLTYEQIWNKLSSREFILVHIKDTMEPALLEAESGKLYEVPVGYIDYDNKKYYRKI